MSEQEFREQLRVKGKRLMDLMHQTFPDAEVKGTIGTVPDDPEYISLVLSAEYRTKMI